MSPIYREILSAEHLFILGAVLRCAARLSKAFSTACLSTPKKTFIRRSKTC